MPSFTFFCEVTDEDLPTYFTEEALQHLVDMGATIRYDHLHNALVTDPSLAIVNMTSERARLVQTLNSLYIPVSAWLLVDKPLGYWANIDNPPEFHHRYQQVSSFVAKPFTLHKFQEWSQENNLIWKSVGLDLVQFFL